MIKKIFSIPNSITISRLSLIPIFILCFYLESFWRFPISCVIFSIAMATDWLDGYIARRLQIASRFGAFLDPLADKLLVIVALILLSTENTVWFFNLSVIVITLREILISALREWLAISGKILKVSSMGKCKTALQMFAILLLLTTSETMKNIGYIVLVAAAFLSVISFVQYCIIIYSSLCKTTRVKTTRV